MSKPSGQCSGGRYREDYPDGTFSGCGRWLTAGDFDLHRVQRDGQPDYARRCLTDAELLERGWVQYPDGSWASPRRLKDAADVRARMRPSEDSGGNPTVTKEQSE